MSTKTVEFDAHRRIKHPVQVEFKTRAGKEVDFAASKPAMVPVHVKFRAKK